MAMAPSPGAHSPMRGPNTEPASDLTAGESSGEGGAQSTAGTQERVGGFVRWR